MMQCDQNRGLYVSQAVSVIIPIGFFSRSLSFTEFI